jgi:hypothetical protein
VTLMKEDVLTWRPLRRFGLWHDRAVFHFLTEDRDKARYLATLSEALTPGGNIVMASFAEDGPDHCSGLPVARYNGSQLMEMLGENFTSMATRREVHTTPAGRVSAVHVDRRQGSFLSRALTPDLE